MTVTIDISQLRLEYLLHHILCVCGVFANVMLLVAIIKDPLKCFRNSSTYLIANLAVSDLIVSFSSPFRVYLPDNVIKLSQIDAFWYTSFFMVISIAADRYIMIAYPFKHRALIKTKEKRIWAWIIFTWLLSFIFPLRKSFSPGNQYDEHITNAISFSVVLIVCTLYTMAYRALNKQEKILKRQKASGPTLNFIQSKASIKKNRRFFTTIVIITLVTGIAICPLTIYEEVSKKRYSSYDGQNKAVTCIFATMLVLNFVVNPFIYIWRLPNYRKTMLVIYCHRSIQH